MELSQQPADLDEAVMAFTSFRAANSRAHCALMLTVQRHLPGGSVMHGRVTFVDFEGKSPAAYEQPAAHSYVILPG